MQESKILTPGTAADVQRELQSFASPTKAKAAAWFFKTGKGQYGEGDKFLGVTVPEQRKVAKQFRDLPLTEIETLLISPIHEHRLMALFILVAQYEKVAKHQKKTTGSTLRVEPRELVEFYLAHRRYVNNWDLVDSSASYILGDWLVTHERSVLKRYIQSKSIWDRRIAILASGALINVGQFDDTLNIAKQLLDDKEDLIHKAVGWMLREIGKRDETVLRNFLDTHAASMPRTMLRYAIEKLSPEIRKQYLARRI